MKKTEEKNTNKTIKKENNNKLPKFFMQIFLFILFLILLLTLVAFSLDFVLNKDEKNNEKNNENTNIGDEPSFFIGKVKGAESDSKSFPPLSYRYAIINNGYLITDNSSFLLENINYISDVFIDHSNDNKYKEYYYINFSLIKDTNIKIYFNSKEDAVSIKSLIEDSYIDIN